MQTNFIALYRGQTVSDARIVAITAEPDIVSRFVQVLSGETDEPGNRDSIAEQPRSPGSLRVVRGDEG